MKFFTIEGINRLSVMNLLYNAGMKIDVDYTMRREDLKNIYEISINEKSSQIIGQLMMLSRN